MAGAAASLLFMLACLFLPLFLRDGMANVVESFQGERIEVGRRGRGVGGFPRRVSEPNYVVEIRDSAGRHVTYVAWEYLPREGGEAVKYLPFLPEVSPRADRYHYAKALFLGLAGGVAGTVPFLLAWSHARNEKTASVAGS